MPPLDALRRYRRDWPRRYAAAVACYRALSHADPEFPEAACPLASRLLCEVLPHCTLMCGRYQSAGMERSRLHLWVFDMRAGVHVDLTSGQFPGGSKGIAVFGTEDRMDAYTLAPLETFHEATRIPYLARKMSDIVVGRTTLARIAGEARAMSATHSRAKRARAPG